VLLDLLIWPLMAIPALLIGLRLMPLLGLEGAFRRPTDGAFFALWLGLLVIANLLFAAALLVPLTLSLIVALAVLLPIVALAHADLRSQALGAIRVVTAKPQLLAGMAALAVAAALVAAQPIYWEDSGLYHIQAIKWLASTGTVPGVALIHSRFGFVSSWFAVPAALSHGILTGRTGALLNGFVLFAMASFMLVTLRRWWLGRHDRADIFFAAAATIVLLFCLQYGIANSPSPDFPIAALTVLAAWSYLAVRNEALPMAPVVLMLGAVTVKFSAAALLLVTAAILLFRLDWRQRAILAIGSGIVLLPVIASSYIATGCLLYPFYLSCAAPDWALGPDNARGMVRAITGFGQWGPSVPPDAGVWNWIPGWPLRRLSNVIFTTFLGLSLIAALVQWRIVTKSSAVRHAAILAVAGMAYVLVTSPETRFVIGALAIMPALLVAALAVRDESIRSEPTRSEHMCTARKRVAIAAVLLGFMAAAGMNTYRLAQAPSRADMEAGIGVAPHWVLPPPAMRLGRPIAPDPAFSEAEIRQGFAARQSGDVVYNIPVPIGLCWDVPLPCATDTLHIVLRLRDPSRGLVGGFARVTP